MTQPQMVVVQCWDDGVTTDIRLVEILRSYGAKATFNLSAGLHQRERRFGWRHAGTEVRRLGLDDMRWVYQGFAVANHSLTHPYLDRMAPEAARADIQEGRHRLEQLFGQTVRGFAYPFGAYNDAVMEMVRETGHLYARTGHRVETVFPPQEAMAFHPSCHFLSPDFWARYEAAKPKGVFYFWGHSYEMVTEAMWQAFESTISGISADPSTRWGEVVDLFERMVD